MPETYIPSPFICSGCNWILGESYRDQNSRVTQLRVFRVARIQGHPELAEPTHEKFSTINLNDGTVVCSHCGNEQTWFANQTAMADMLQRKSLRRMAVTNG